MKLKAAFILGLICFPVLSADAYQVVEINASAIASNASKAFRGMCEKRESRMVQEGPINRVVTHYVFSVTDVIKGDVGSRFEFDQWGATRSDAQKLGAPYAVGFVQFDPGKEYVVFLDGPTSLGLYAPMGMAQGVFNVVYNEEGKAMVVNNFKNTNLFKGLPRSANVTKALNVGKVDRKNPPAGPILYDDFRKMVDVLK